MHHFGERGAMLSWVEMFYPAAVSGSHSPHITSVIILSVPNKQTHTHTHTLVIVFFCGEQRPDSDRKWLRAWRLVLRLDWIKPEVTKSVRTTETLWGVLKGSRPLRKPRPNASCVVTSLHGRGGYIRSFLTGCTLFMWSGTTSCVGSCTSASSGGQVELLNHSLVAFAHSHTSDPLNTSPLMTHTLLTHKKSLHSQIFRLRHAYLSWEPWRQVVAFNLLREETNIYIYIFNI